MRIRRMTTMYAFGSRNDSDSEITKDFASIIENGQALLAESKHWKERYTRYSKLNSIGKSMQNRKVKTSDLSKQNSLKQDSGQWG